MRDTETSAIDEQASDWVVRLADPDVDSGDHLAFDAWLHSAPGNARAYEQALDLHCGLEGLRDRFVSESYVQAGKKSTGMRWGAAMLAAAASVAAFLFVLKPSPTSWSAPVTTATAETRDITLPDGSSVVLGARSRIELAFTGDARRVRLSDGEAFFDVAHDPARPFFVEAPGALVRVVGTQFEVKAMPGQVRIVVARGLVDVTEDRALPELLGTAAPHRLQVGQQILIAKMGPGKTVESEAPKNPAAWRKGVLAYQEATLAEVIADANRYSAKPIRISDSSLAELRITASYPASQMSQLLSTLRLALPLDVVDDGGNEIRLKARR